MRLHVHLISDSTGETLENLAKAAIAQFDDVEVVRHFWPMVRSEAHLDRIMAEVKASPGLILFTLVNLDLRASRGLDKAFVDKYFTWTASRIGGIGLDVVAREMAGRKIGSAVVLEHGAVIEAGTHAELLARNRARSSRAKAKCSSPAARPRART